MNATFPCRRATSKKNSSQDQVFSGPFRSRFVLLTDVGELSWLDENNRAGYLRLLILASRRKISR
jgi:hypothetical protein